MPLDEVVVKVQRDARRMVNAIYEASSAVAPMAAAFHALGQAANPEPDEVPVHWEQRTAGMDWLPRIKRWPRGAPAMVALGTVLGLRYDAVEKMLQAAMNERLIEVRARKRVFKSQVEKYSQRAMDGVPREVINDVMEAEEWQWVPTKSPADPRTLHLRYDELPMEALVGQAVLRLSADEYAAVVRGVVHHFYDPSREGTRMVYGYWAPRDTVEVVASMRDNS